MTPEIGNVILLPLYIPFLAESHTYNIIPEM